MSKDVVAILAVMLVGGLVGGCWTASQPAANDGALLRRHQAAGAHLRVCERGEALYTAVGIDPTKATIRMISLETVLARPAPDRFQVRVDTVSGSTWDAEGDHTPRRSTEQAPAIGVPFVIDDRNRKLSPPVAPAPAVGDASPVPDFSIDSLPNLPDLIDVTYPEGPLHAGDAFPIHLRRTVHDPNSVPTDIAVDLQFVVKAIDATTIELACSGTLAEHAKRDNTNASVALAITCRAILDRDDGRTGRWWIDSSGHGDIPEPDGPQGMDVRSHFDVVLGRVPGDTTCERALEPD